MKSHTPTRIHVELAAISVLLGVLGDVLLRAHPFGLNVVLWLALVVIGVVYFAHRNQRLSKNSHVLLIVAMLFSFTFLWRDSSVLKILSVCAMFSAFALAAQWVNHLKLRTTGFLAYKLAMLEGIAALIKGAPQLFLSDCAAYEKQWQATAGAEASRRLKATLRGVAIAIPLLVVFGLLFLSADLAYRKIIIDFFDMETLPRHLLLFFIFTWLSASILKSLMDGQTCEIKAKIKTEKLHLGGIEIGIIMTLLNLLFLSFVIVQFQYLFGGEDRIRSIAGLTYSEYARHGFFELCIVSVLVLCMLLVLDWLLRNAIVSAKRIFRILSLGQLIMVGVIMASAFQRMRMYQDAYGLTQLRFYVMAMMIWLAVLFIWFAATVLQGKREYFTFGGYVAGLLAIFALHCINPDALIVKSNAARVSDGKGFDAHYALRLSSDAVPALLAALPQLEEKDAEQIKSVLSRKSQSSDWRTWNWSRHMAEKAIQKTLENFPILKIPPPNSSTN